MEEIGVGETREFRLSTFYDQHGKPFRGGGGFFAARDPEAIVLAQIVQTSSTPPTPPTPPTAPPPESELLGLIGVGGGTPN